MGYVSNVVAHTRANVVLWPILVLDRNLAVDNEDDMACLAPLVCDVIPAEGNKTHLNVAGLARSLC